MGIGKRCKHFDGQTSEKQAVATDKILPAEILHRQCVAEPHHGVQHPRGPDVRSRDQGGLLCFVFWKMYA